jgi:hypothetical protein
LGAFLGPLLTRPFTPAFDPRTTNEKESGAINAGERDDASTLGQPPSLSGTTATIHPRSQGGPDNPDDEIRAIYTLADDDHSYVRVKQHPNDLIREEMLFDEEEGKDWDRKTKNDGMIVRLMPGASTFCPINRMLMCASVHSPYLACSECIYRQEREWVPELEGLLSRVE